MRALPNIFLVTNSVAVDPAIQQPLALGRCANNGTASMQCTRQLCTDVLPDWPQYQQHFQPQKRELCLTSQGP
jgi:hypothetical protein